MITKVLADHPNSAKAHYVQAELYAKEGKDFAGPRSELSVAERLKPGFDFLQARDIRFKS